MSDEQTPTFEEVVLAKLEIIEKLAKDTASVNKRTKRLELQVKSLKAELSVMGRAFSSMARGLSDDDLDE